MLLADESVSKNLNAEVLKVPHHRSDTSSTMAFLKAVAPQWRVISVGKKNIGTNKVFMHPRLSTIKNLLDFAGSHTNERWIDVFDSEKRVWASKSIWGNLFLISRDGSVVLMSDGTEVTKK